MVMSTSRLLVLLTFTRILAIAAYVGAFASSLYRDAHPGTASERATRQSKRFMIWVDANRVPAFAPSRDLFIQNRRGPPRAEPV